MAINDVLSALAEKLGLKTTRLQDLHVLREKVEDDIRRNQDKLGDLKNEVADLDAKLRAKKKEYDAAGPGIRQIIKREFAFFFKQQEQVLETLNGISARLNNDAVLLHKTKVLISSLESQNRVGGDMEDPFDDVAIELGIEIDNQRAENKSAKELDKVRFPSTDEISEERIASLSADGRTNVSSSSSTAREEQDDLDRMIAEIH